MHAELAPANTMPLVLRRHPFEQSPGFALVRPGQRLGAMISQAAGGAELSGALEARIAGHVVPRELWDRVTPKEGTVIEVTVIPAGNMNANWRAVLMIAVTVVAWYAAPYLVGAYGGTAAMWVSGITMAANLAMSALVKPPSPGGLSTSDEKKWNQLTGSSNQINPGGVVPIILGEARFFPPHAALPYTASSWDASTQYCLFDLGYNVEADDVSDLRIGDTPISNYADVAWQVSTNPSIYKNDVSEQSIVIELARGDEVVRGVGLGTETIVVDLLFPQGYYRIDAEGAKHWMAFYCDVQYRPTGTTTWLDPVAARLTTLQLNVDAEPGLYMFPAGWYVPFAAAVEFDVPAGEYEVRVANTTEPPTTTASTHIDTVYYGTLRSIRHVPASTTGTTKLALRIKANDQLSGVLQTLSCMVRPKFPVYNEGTGTWARARTLNAAWLYRYLLTACPTTKIKVPTSRMNLDQLLDFAEFCDDHDLETRMVVDSASTLGQVTDMLLRTSAGERTMTDGKYGVTFVPVTAPMLSADYAPMEVKDFTLIRNFSRIPHALRVKFRNPEANWQADELVVVDDGYSWRGKDARGAASALPEATLFETLDVQATLTPEHAWRLARMHFAQGKFSPGMFSWASDIAALKLTKGAAASVAHDVPEWGVGAGRILSLTAGGLGGAATVVLDSEVDTDPAKTYRVQIRGPGGTQAVNVTPHSARTDTFYLATMPTGVEAGDVGILGDTAVEKPTLLITHMRSSGNLEFTISAVAWDSRAAPYWADPPPTFVSEIAGLVYSEPPDPPQITIDAAGETTDDAGIVTPIVNIGSRPPSGFRRPLAETMLQ